MAGGWTRSTESISLGLSAGALAWLVSLEAAGKVTPFQQQVGVCCPRNSQPLASAPGFWHLIPLMLLAQ